MQPQKRDLKGETRRGDVYLLRICQRPWQPWCGMYCVAVKPNRAKGAAAHVSLSGSPGATRGGSLLTGRRRRARPPAPIWRLPELLEEAHCWQGARVARLGQLSLPIWQPYLQCAAIRVARLGGKSGPIWQRWGGYGRWLQYGDFLETPMSGRYFFFRSLGFSPLIG